VSKSSDELLTRQITYFLTYSTYLANRPGTGESAVVDVEALREARVVRHLGKVVQVDPIKPTLKAPGNGRLKLKCDILLSSFAIRVNLRRYTPEFPLYMLADIVDVYYVDAYGRAVQIDPMKPVLKAPGTMLLKPICDERLSNFAFKFNLRCYITAPSNTSKRATTSPAAPTRSSHPLANTLLSTPLQGQGESLVPPHTRGRVSLYDKVRETTWTLSNK